MNRKRKVLTVAGLVAFAVIVWAHIANEDHIEAHNLYWCSEHFMPVYMH